MEENILEKIDFKDFSPIELGKAEAELTDLINQAQEMIEECDEILNGGENNG